MTKQILIWGSIAGALVSIMLFVTMILGAGKLVYETKDAAILKESDCKDRTADIKGDVRDLKKDFSYVRGDIDDLKRMLNERLPR